MAANIVFIFLRDRYFFILIILIKTIRQHIFHDKKTAAK